MDNDTQRRQFHLTAFNFFAQIFRCATNHQAADEHRQNRIHDHVHQTDTLAAEYDVEHHVQQRHHTTQRRQCVVHIINGTRCKRSGRRGKHG